MANEMEEVRVMVVDDHPVVRLGVSAIVNSQSDMTVVAQAASVEEALRFYSEKKPDLTLMDLRLSDESGVTAIRQITRLSPTARILVLTTFEWDQDIPRALSAGAVGYVIKGGSNETLLHAMRRALIAEVSSPKPHQDIG